MYVDVYVSGEWLAGVDLVWACCVEVEACEHVFDVVLF